jgi:hypothetical protein
MGVAVYLNLFYAGRAQHKCTLDANSIRRDSPHGEIGLIAAFPQANDGSSHELNTLALAFHNSQMYGHTIARPESGEVFIIGRI